MLRCPGSKFVLSTLLALVVLALPGSSQAKFRVLYTFQGGSDGSDPIASMILDAAGNLYGTTVGGGGSGCGTVFRLAPDDTETVLYTFSCGKDGADPAAALIMDGSGNLYGTALNGGTVSACQGQQGGPGGCGTVFKLAPDGTETVLYTFCRQNGCADGALPNSVLIKDRAGNFYGTTGWGGSTGCQPVGCGTVFKLAPDGNETVLYAFQGGSDGEDPSAASLIRDKSGNLYGTTAAGGAGNSGVVFKVAPDGTETLLHAFDFEDGSSPGGEVAMDKSGNIYGTTGWGIVLGTAYKLSPDGALTTLHTFMDAPDGANPFGGVVMDNAGNIYGTTWGGGRNCGDYGSTCGTVFKIAPDGTETVLHAFRKAKGDGILPQAGLVKDGKGHLYGTTSWLNWQVRTGTIFEITP